MTPRLPHLFVDISAHGFGHLAQVAPVLNELAGRVPGLRLTLRSALPIATLRARLQPPFDYLNGRSDVGFAMRDALTIDRAASAAAYRAQHADWARLVAVESETLTALNADLVLTDVAYLPLAGAASAGIGALSMCSLNWADVFAHYFSGQPWAATIHAQMLAAYRSADCFLRLTPAMAMEALPKACAIAPVAALGRDCRELLRTTLDCRPEEKLVLIAFGGIDKRLPVDRWPRAKGLRWLVPANWPAERADISAFEPLGLAFTDLLCSVDAVVTKPGYGSFSEAACNGTPVLYVRRADGWPEEDCLIDWLQRNGRCSEISASTLLAGTVHAALGELWRQPAPVAPCPTGAAEAAALIAGRLIDCKRAART